MGINRQDLRLTNGSLLQILQGGSGTGNPGAVSTQSSGSGAPVRWQSGIVGPPLEARNRLDAVSLRARTACPSRDGVVRCRIAYQRTGVPLPAVGESARRRA